MAQQGNFAGRTERMRLMKEAESLLKESRRVHQLINSILSNGAYSGYEEMRQLQRMEMTRGYHKRIEDTESLARLDREKELVARAWKYRRAKADEAMDTLEKILNAHDAIMGGNTNTTDNSRRRNLQRKA